MSLEEKFKPGSEEWKRVRDTSVGKPKPDDVVIIPRPGSYSTPSEYAKRCKTRAEYEKFRRKVLATPLP